MLGRPAQLVTKLRYVIGTAATIPTSSSSHEAPPPPLLELGLGELLVLLVELGLGELVVLVLELGLGELLILVLELGHVWQVVEQSVCTMYANSPGSGPLGEVASAYSADSSSHNCVPTNAHEPVLASCFIIRLSGLAFDIILINFFSPTSSSGVCLHE